MVHVVPKDEAVVVKVLRPLSLNRAILPELFPTEVARIAPDKTQRYESAMVASAYYTACSLLYSPAFIQMPLKELVEIMPRLTGPEGPDAETIVREGVLQLRALGYARVIEFVGVQYLEPTLNMWQVGLGLRVTEATPSQFARVR